MHRITKADIIFSVGRGLIMAAAIVGATYFLGSWYFGDSDPDTIYQSQDSQTTSLAEHATAAASNDEATQ